uniref:Immunoglobulin V-set domain-containing protein n=1 Tax=Labrus bergylta TaxID=56723 RepID=A0A3Q3GRF0_9LABR
MSAFWLKLITFLLNTITLNVCASVFAESNGVERRDPGGSVTIQCKFPQSSPASLTLMKGLNDDSQVLYKMNASRPVIAKDFKSRLQIHGEFPNLDILIRNLTSEDTGPYWCKYQKSASDQKAVNDTAKTCDQSNKNLILVSVVVLAAVLVGIILAFLVWIIKVPTCVNVCVSLCV